MVEIRRALDQVAHRGRDQGILLCRAAVGAALLHGPGVGGWMILGVICLIDLYVRDPRRASEVGLVHRGDGLWQG